MGRFTLVVPTGKREAPSSEVRMEMKSGGDQYCLNCGLPGKTRKRSYSSARTSYQAVTTKIHGQEEWPRRKQSEMSLSTIFVILNYILIPMILLSLPSVLSNELNSRQRDGGGSNFFAASPTPQHSPTADFGGGMGGDYDTNDMIMTCSRPVKSSRAAKYLAIKQLDIPCDMGDRKSAWCNLPGDKYPWHAVRRFVFENQGLMRRMYGEVRQLSLLRMEFEDDMDDEEEEERQGPPRSPPLPEDHRRNSILTEVLDESLPRVLSEASPEDQLLLKDHKNLVRSTPRTLSSTAFTPPPPSAAMTPESTVSTSTQAVVVTTPIAFASSEEQVNTSDVTIGIILDNNVTRGAETFTNNPTIFTTPTTGTADMDTTSPLTISSTNVARNGLSEEMITEESTQPTADVTETEKESTDTDGETIVTTTEQMTSFSEQEVGGAEEAMDQVQQLNDGLQDNIGAATSLGSDESHDFLNLDQNHILYFDDVGKPRRPVASPNGDTYAPSLQQQQQTGKIKAVNACPVKEEVVAPYWANNTRGEILALLNLYPFEQYIHWERCNHENKQMFCRQGCRCEQQYRLHRLLAFDPTNECRGIFSDWFRFPSCCVCRCYLNEYELMMLNAAGQEQSDGSSGPKSRTSDRIRSPRKMLLDQLVDGPDVHGVDDMHFFYKQGFYHEHNHGAQPRRRRSPPVT